jgi:NifU-like protein involved in Fe-S cluster formation
MIKGKTIASVLAISGGDVLKELGGLPERFAHCATLAADALKAAISDYLAFAREPWKRAYRQDQQ